MNQKIIFLALFGFFFCVSIKMGHAQAIISTAISPTNPTVGDSVFLDIESMLTSGGCGINGYTTNVNGTSITTEVCYNQGLLAVICNHRDTLYLGNNFTVGNNTLTIWAKSTGSLSDSLCDLSGPSFDSVVVNFTVDIGNGVPDYKPENQFGIYPSLIHGDVFLKINGKVLTEGKMEWLDSKGLVVKSLDFKSLGNNSRLPVDVSGLKPGVYLVRFLPVGQAATIQKVLILE